MRQECLLRIAGGRRLVGICLASMLLWGQVPHLLAETVVEGPVSSAEWTEAESPYHVTGHVEIPEDATLTIGEGVVITLDEGRSIRVRGKLLIQGSAEKTVKLERHDEDHAWGGIVFSGPDAEGNLEHMELGGASSVASEPAAFNVTGGAKVHLGHCWFHDFPGVVIDSTGGSELVVLDTLIERSKEAIHSARSYARVERVTIRDVFGYSDCIDYDYDSDPVSVIRDCLLENNEEDDGVDLGSASPIVENVVIRGVKAGKAVSMDGNSSPVLRGLLIVDCMWGIVSKDSCTPIIQNCTVTRCEKAVNCYQKINGKGGGHGTAHSMILWDNEESVSLDDLSTFTMTHSIVGGGYDGEGNLDVDPLFVNEDDDDFRLQAESPAVGSGKEGMDMGAFPVTVPPPPTFIRGETNQDGNLDIADPVLILLYLLKGQEATCLDALDSDDSGSLDITDAIYTLRYLFLAGPPPPLPFPSPGPDPTDGDPYDCGPVGP